MIDIHCHVLPGVDDGSRNLEESIELIISAQKLGYKKLCCTSHYKTEMYQNKNYDKVLNDLRKELKKREIEIELLEGNELYLDIDGLSGLKAKKVNTLNKGSYLLVEAMPGMTYMVLKKYLEKIFQMKYKVVLAHVERYSFINKKSLHELKKMKVVTQVNLKSLRHKKNIYEWIELGLIDILSSDAHDRKYRNYELEDVITDIENKFGIETRKKLLEENPKKIINSEGIEYIEDIKGEIDEKKVSDTSTDNNNFIKRFFKKLKLR